MPSLSEISCFQREVSAGLPWRVSNTRQVAIQIVAAFGAPRPTISPRSGGFDCGKDHGHVPTLNEMESRATPVSEGRRRGSRNAIRISCASISSQTITTISHAFLDEFSYGKH
jgi:hypothetical protein